MGQVHVRLDDQTKSEWEDYAEASGYGSLSRLIRQAVEKERHGEHTTATDSGNAVPTNVATADDVDQIGDSILQLVDRIEGMEERLKIAEKGTLEPTDKRAVLSSLPSDRPDPDSDGYEKVDDPDLERPNAGVATDGTAESVAAVANEPVAATRAFLAESAHRTDDLKAEKVGGKLRFWMTRQEGQATEEEDNE